MQVYKQVDSEILDQYLLYPAGQYQLRIEQRVHTCLETLLIGVTPPVDKNETIF